MNKTCEFCQYNGPYGSIINPCENCPNNDFQVGFPPVETTKTTFYTTTTTDEKTITINSNGANTGDVFVTGLITNLPIMRHFMDVLYVVVVSTKHLNVTVAENG